MLFWVWLVGCTVAALHCGCIGDGWMDGWMDGRMDGCCLKWGFLLEIVESLERRCATFVVRLLFISPLRLPAPSSFHSPLSFAFAFHSSTTAADALQARQRTADSGQRTERQRTADSRQQTAENRRLTAANVEPQTDRLD